MGSGVFDDEIKYFDTILVIDSFGLQIERLLVAAYTKLGSYIFSAGFG